MLFQELNDFVGFLMGHKPAGYLARRPRRYDRLYALTLEPSPHAYHIQSGSRPEPFGDGETGLSKKLRDSRSFLVFVLIERNLGKRLTLGLCELKDVVVEPIHQDLPVSVFHTCYDLGQGNERVVYRAAGASRMEILPRTLHLNLDPAKPPGTGRERGDLAGVHPAVHGNHQVALQKFLVVDQESFEIGATDLLFPFKQELHVDRQPVAPQGFLHSHDRRKHPAFVVGRSAGKHFAVSYLRFERFGHPLVQRVCGLSVVVPVDHDRRGSGILCAGPAVDYGMTSGGDHPDILDPCALHPRLEPLGSPLNIGFVLGQCADTWNGEKLEKLTYVRHSLSPFYMADVPAAFTITILDVVW